MTYCHGPFIKHFCQLLTLVTTVLAPPLLRSPWQRAINQDFAKGSSTVSDLQYLEPKDRGCFHSGSFVVFLNLFHVVLAFAFGMMLTPYPSCIIKYEIHGLLRSLCTRPTGLRPSDTAVMPGVQGCMCSATALTHKSGSD